MSLVFCTLFAFFAGSILMFLVMRSHHGSLVAAGTQNARMLDASLAECKGQILRKEVELDSQRELLSVATQSLARLETELAFQKDAAEGKIRTLQDIGTNLKQSFDVLAKDALRDNSRSLLEATKAEWQLHHQAAEGQLKERHTAIDVLLQPMRASLDKLSEHTQQLEVDRKGAYQELLTTMSNIGKSHADLKGETQQLVQALRSPRVRGNWGELQLKRCIEFAGMVQHASFDVQASVRDEEKGYRPDLVVHLPNGRTIIVDAKTPLEAFLSANSTVNEEEQGRFLTKHAANVRDHLRQLSSKAYWRQFDNSPDFVICFLPSEVLFSAALEKDPGLIEFSASSNVLLATPTTLIAMLKAIACGWQQAEIAENSKRIQELATKAYSKLCGMQKDFQVLGRSLTSASNAYNGFLTKVEGQGGVFTLARKINTFRIGDTEIPETSFEVITQRQLVADDWQEPLALAAAGNDADHARPEL